MVPEPVSTHTERERERERGHRQTSSADKGNGTRGTWMEFMCEYISLMVWNAAAHLRTKGSVSAPNLNSCRDITKFTKGQIEPMIRTGKAKKAEKISDLQSLGEQKAVLDGGQMKLRVVPSRLRQLSKLSWRTICET